MVAAKTSIICNRGCDQMATADPTELAIARFRLVVGPRWLLAFGGSPPTARSDISSAHARAEKDSFVELDRHPQISLLEGEEWAEGVRIVDRELTS